MREDGEIGRFKVRKLMSEMNLVACLQEATVERPDILNVLDRVFKVSTPSEVRYGDITYAWDQGQWHYLAAVIDLLFAV